MQHLSLTRHYETTDRPPDRPITDGRCVMLQRGRTVINEEADALRNLACHLDASFGNLAEAVLATRGMVVVSGLGKSWLVGARLSATLAATGTRSIMLHPTDALHGDLGRLREGDLLLIISNSGETPEVLALIGAARTAVPGLAIAALTGNGTSSIARAANLAVSVGKLHEACSLGLAPTTSAIVFAALGDALVVATAAARGFNMRDFARIHPGGALGQRVQAPERVVEHATNGDWTPLQGSLSSAGHSREISQGEHS